MCMIILFLIVYIYPHIQFKIKQLYLKNNEKSRVVIFCLTVKNNLQWIIGLNSGARTADVVTSSSQLLFQSQKDRRPVLSSFGVWTPKTRFQKNTSLYSVSLELRNGFSVCVFMSSLTIYLIVLSNLQLWTDLWHLPWYWSMNQNCWYPNCSHSFCCRATHTVPATRQSLKQIFSNFIPRSKSWITGGLKSQMLTATTLENKCISAFIQ